jgi:hypothetical protein
MSIRFVGSTLAKANQSKFPLEKAVLRASASQISTCLVPSGPFKSSTPYYSIAPKPDQQALKEHLWVHVMNKTSGAFKKLSKKG